MKHANKLDESLEYLDMKGVIHDEIHVDQYKSKMGSDEDIMVISFKVKNKDVASDLCDFIEKGYDWILDADTSSGELDDGKYVVFIEMERTEESPEQLKKLFVDLRNLTGRVPDDWRFYNQKDFSRFGLNEFAQSVPLTPQAYKDKQIQKQLELDQLKSAAGAPVTKSVSEQKRIQKFLIDNFGVF